ncbi:PREDICTED: uncharacterized protein LOC105459537 [Wasmannia auropunctata]|uniref:uncharacterized protein LOC105459537 n=1 Tax=Wasmannia auropunctata TaxID=64793 RepID=UPI0005EE07ED|nr:PREDICTED: uncharacterized protein LOC105459537 [Wasmannia auropunctata]
MTNICVKINYNFYNRGDCVLIIRKFFNTKVSKILKIDRIRYMGLRLLRQSMLGIRETTARCPSPTFLTKDKLLGVGWELPVIGQDRIGSTPRTTLHGKGSSVRHRLLSNLPRSVPDVKQLSGYQDYVNQW